MVNSFSDNSDQDPKKIHQDRQEQIARAETFHRTPAKSGTTEMLLEIIRDSVNDWQIHHMQQQEFHEFKVRHEQFLHSRGLTLPDKSVAELALEPIADATIIKSAKLKYDALVKILVPAVEPYYSPIAQNIDGEKLSHAIIGIIEQVLKAGWEQGANTAEAQVRKAMAGHPLPPLGIVR